MVEGSIPLALPGGQAHKKREPKAPLIEATPAVSEAAFSGGDNAPAFWKSKSKKAFGR
jgi:hypothetical protein